MKDFQYFGLFLSDETKDYLLMLLLNDNKYRDYLDYSNRIYLDHCTLIHKCHLNALNLNEDSNLFAKTNKLIGRGFKLTITGLGISDKAMAFKVEIPDELTCLNATPHITICTFGNGKPVYSNNITEWENIEPISITTTFKNYNYDKRRY
jgi:hypothetical protein